MVIDGRRVGPFPKHELKSRGLTPETMVWTAGMQTWMPAKVVDDLAAELVPGPEESAFGTYAEMPPEPAAPAQPRLLYYAMMGSERIGPMTGEELIRHGLKAQTPVWCREMSIWAPASTRADLMALMQGGANPYYGRQPQPPYGSFNGYNSNISYKNQPSGQPQGQPTGTPHYNWMTWAIIGTVLGGLFSCIGLIFGIIAINKASAANRYYSVGDDMQGDRENGSAKTMTIISLVLAGIGLAANVWFFRNMSSTFTSGIL